MLDGITNSSKIYIFCPAGGVTGGPELLHQLADLLFQLNREVYIVYYKGNNIVTSETPEPYKKYKITSTTELDYSKENVFIVPESSVYLLSQVKVGIRMIWWLSVDNYFYYCPAFTHYSFLYNNYAKALLYTVKEKFGDIIKHRTPKTRPNTALSEIDNSVIHLYQSEYARDFLLKKGFSHLYPLKDYINDDYFFLTESNSKLDTVIYNPKKGFEFTKKLIEADSSISWLPIQNMNREQVKDALKTAKLYIDFGNHPGMDRMPREAAICGCCIITGKRGAAKFFQDVPISDDYKFNQNKSEVKKILDKIHYVLDNYESVCHDFDSYRELIRHQKRDFSEDAKKIFFFVKK